MDEKPTLETFLDAVLQQELQTTSDQICSNSYFHGSINRLAAETLLLENGQFLLRESSSQRGQYVLSCLHNGTHLHFIIHEHPSSGSSQFSFEDALFNSVGELIAHHVRDAAPITVTSGALIKEPVNRTAPLHADKLRTYYERSTKTNLADLLKDTSLLSRSCDKDDSNSSTSATPQVLRVPSSEYLKQLQLGTSAIKLEEIVDNKSGDFDQNFEHLCRNACHIIAQTGPGILASHLFKRELVFFGIDYDQDVLDSENTCLIRSGIELMCLPCGKQIRRDIIIRYECFKYFVIMTVIKVKDTSIQCSILKKWIQIANELISSFGDYFGFGAILDGLSHVKVAKLTLVWSKLRAEHPKETALFEHQLKPHFLIQLSAREPNLAPNTTFPFVIQLCHLIECNSIVNSKLLPLLHNIDYPELIKTEVENNNQIGLDDFSLDDIIMHINLSTNILSNLTLFERNTKMVYQKFFFREHSLEELFKTTFHLQFLFNQKIDITRLNRNIFQKLEQQLSTDDH